MPGIKDKVILALDVENFAKARYFLNLLHRKIKIFKVGSQLFTACGPQIIKAAHKSKVKVFLDLKFHDIPNTVANAVRQAVRLKIKMLTLHISGGKDMLTQAVEAAKEESLRLGIRKPLLIGVTILTSQKSSPAQVLRLTKLGLSCGLDGIVCSPLEAKTLRKKIKQKFIIVTPGIRAKTKPCDDQKRTATAGEAFKAGADFIVVGRPILKAPDPLKAVEEIF